MLLLFILQSGLCFITDMLLSKSWMHLGWNVQKQDKIHLVIDNYNCLMSCFYAFFPYCISVFPEDSDADREANTPDKHPSTTARHSDPHSSRLPSQSAIRDDNGTHAIPLPTGCTVLHPTGETQSTAEQIKNSHSYMQCGTKLLMTYIF